MYRALGNTSDTGQSWRRARACSGGDCVEILFDSNLVLLRDSKQRSVDSQQIIRFSHPEWRSLITELKITNSTAQKGVTVSIMECGTAKLNTRDAQIEFNESEWSAFVDGIRAGEFDLN